MYKDIISIIKSFTIKLRFINKFIREIIMIDRELELYYVFNYTK